MRIAIVNDMVFAVETMRRVLARAQGHELAWVARDGEEAVELCAQDRPDLVLMDLVMPRMDGVEATRRIMAGSPCAIIVVTANVNQNSSKVFEAMGAGALDAVDTPSLDRPGSLGGSDALLGKIRTINRLIGREAQPRVTPPHVAADGPAPERPAGLVVIGASAGGPAAIAELLSPLPADFPEPILVVQHVDAQFVQGLAEWLDYRTELSVRIAREGDEPEPGAVLLAGADQHLVLVGRGRVGYVTEPFDAAYCPSIDICLWSALEFWDGRITGVLLTGMGRDGAAGLKSLRDAGHHTLVQDEATSAVFGMPKAAIESGAAAEVLPLGLIGPRLLQLAAGEPKRAQPS